MNVIQLASTIAIALGLCGVLPHIVLMLRKRSAAGQSPLAWAIAVTVNALMGCVNLFGYEATELAAGNVAGGALCLTALGCSLLLPREATQPAAIRPEGLFLELPTGELALLGEAIDSERTRRAERRAFHEAPTQMLRHEAPTQILRHGPPTGDLGARQPIAA